MLLEQATDWKRTTPQNGEVLYHKDKGFPDNIDMPRGFNPVVNLNYGGHAKMEALKDKYGQMHLPHRVDVRKGETIEIGVTGRTVTKLVLRFSYDAEKDIIIVLMPESSFVKTVWFNLKSDQHKTLDLSRYADPKRRAA